MRAAKTDANNTNSGDKRESTTNPEKVLTVIIGSLSQKYLTGAVGKRLEIPTSAEWEELHQAFESYHKTRRGGSLTLENIGNRWRKLDKKRIGLQEFLVRWVDRLCGLPMSPRAKVYHAMLAIDSDLDHDVLHDVKALWDSQPNTRRREKGIAHREKTTTALKRQPKLGALKQVFDFLGNPHADLTPLEFGELFDNLARLVSPRFKALAVTWSKLEITPGANSRLDNQLKSFYSYAAVLELHWQQGVWREKYGGTTTQLQRILPLLDEQQFQLLRRRFCGAALGPSKLKLAARQLAATERQRRHRGA